MKSVGPIGFCDMDLGTTQQKQKNKRVVFQTMGKLLHYEMLISFCAIQELIFVIIITLVMVIARMSAYSSRCNKKAHWRSLGAVE